MRLVDSGSCHPRESLWIEDAILQARAAGEVPDTLHIYRRDRPTVSMGRFSRRKDCVVDTGALERGVEVIRRQSGGSCIYTDEKQLIYSIVMDRDHLPSNRLQTFPLICSGLVEALGSLGLEAVYKPVNDVLVDGKKISGSAQTRHRGALMQHGTIIMELNRENMDAVLVPIKERSYPGLTSLQEQGVVAGWDELKEALRKGFEKVLACRIDDAPLSDYESRMVLEKRLNDDASCHP
ncbi:MAG: biotin/lipoate A/B protein ligase family protein [Candidatus Methanomethylophilaceae archaeon]|nr:biotin/lipoate A/B protein ligase family protein [Candidatus Methanomethylophilaceae archaeon]